MLRESSDEEIGAILEKYKISAKNFEKDLMMLQIKSDGNLSLNDVYNMTYTMRERYVEAFNEFSEERKRALNK